MKKTAPEIKQHPDYVRFSNLMHGGVIYTHSELRAIQKSDSFKALTRLFPKSDPSGVQGPDSATQPGMTSSAPSAPSSPTRAS